MSSCDIATRKTSQKHPRVAHIARWSSIICEHLNGNSSYYVPLFVYLIVNMKYLWKIMACLGDGDGDGRNGPMFTDFRVITIYLWVGYIPHWTSLLALALSLSLTHTLSLFCIISSSSSLWFVPSDLLDRVFFSSFFISFLTLFLSNFQIFRRGQDDLMNTRSAVKCCLGLRCRDLSSANTLIRLSNGHGWCFMGAVCVRVCVSVCASKCTKYDDIRMLRRLSGKYRKQCATQRLHRWPRPLTTTMTANMNGPTSKNKHNLHWTAKC